MINNENFIIKNLKEICHYMLGTYMIRELYNEKTEKVKREKNSPLLNYTITLVGNYS